MKLAQFFLPRDFHALQIVEAAGSRGFVLSGEAAESAAADSKVQAAFAGGFGENCGGLLVGVGAR